MGLQSGQEPVKRWTLKRCLWLCLPALVLGAVLRVGFLAAIPQVYYGSDSNSYFYTCSALWNEHRVTLPAKRRYLYPLLMTPLPALPGSPVVAVAVMQHTVGMLTLVGIGWVTGSLVRRKVIWVPAVTLLAAVWPRMLWYEHELMAEPFVLAMFVLAVALSLPVAGLRCGRRFLWFLWAAALIMAFKPHGRPIWLALVFLGLWMSWRGFPWNRKHALAAGVSAFLVLTGGSNSQGAWLFLNSALPLVQLDGEKWREYREILRPMVEESRSDLLNYATRQRVYKKTLNSTDRSNSLGQEWVRLCKDPVMYGKVAGSLAVEAVLSAPGTYAGMVTRKILLAFSNEQVSAFAPARFWKKQEELNRDRWEERRRELELLYNTDRAGYDRMAAEGAAKRFWVSDWESRFKKLLSWTLYEPGVEGGAPRIRPTWMGGLVALGLLASLRRVWWRGAALVWVPAVFYLVLTYAVGDSIPRYVHPVEWCGMVLMALGGESVLDALGWAWRAVAGRKSSEPRSALPEKLPVSG